MKTRQHGTTTTAVVALAGTLALGACGVQRTASEDVTSEQAQSAVIDGTPAQDQAAVAAQLQELRTRYPTAGTEVPPADLLRAPTPSGEGTGTTGGSSPLTRPHHIHRYVQ